MSESMTISGLQEVQDVHLRLIAAFRPEGAAGRLLQYVTTALHRYATSVTHVDTEALRASHRMSFDSPENRASIYLDPSATNPRTGALTSEYGPVEEARGGTHAFYARTVQERGNQAIEAGARAFFREVFI